MDYRITRQLQDDELMHYGVLGMRWGHRRAQKLQNKAKGMRISAKELEDIAKYKESKGKTKAASKMYEKVKQERQQAAQVEAKAKSIQNKHIERAGGKKAYDYTTKQSTGKTAAKSLIFGTYGAMRYNEARAKGTSRAKSLVNGMLYGGASRSTGGVVGVVEPRLRESKNKQRIKNTYKKAKNYMLDE